MYRIRSLTRSIVTYDNNPEIKKNMQENRAKTLQGDPSIMKNSAKKRGITLQNDSTIMEKAMIKRKEHYDCNPGKKNLEVLKMKETRILIGCNELQSINKLQYYSDHPEQRAVSSAKAIERYENFPEIKIKISKGVSRYYKQNPQAGIKKTDSLLRTLEEHPEILIKASKKRSSTFRETGVMKEVGKNHAIDSILRNEIKQRCLSLIDQYDLKDLNIPSNKNYSKKWKEFEEFLLNKIRGHL